MRMKYTLAVCMLVLSLFSPVVAQQIVLRGTVVTPDDVIQDGFVAIQQGKIVGVGPYADRPRGMQAVATHSIIYPGLIDLHDHITWNLFPRWRENVQFSTRYQWQQVTSYGIALSTPHAQLFQDGFGCQSNRFGEVKAIVGGATSVVGSLGPSKPDSSDNQCIMGLARNLDFYSGFYGTTVNMEKLRYEVFPMQVSLEQVNQIKADLNSGKLTSYIVHLAEGNTTDANAAREFNMFQAQGFLRPGVSIIHGVALGRAQFRQLATNSVGLIWSPRSNVELYGVTTDVAAAKQEGVKIAISPDWSPSGSDGLLQELKYAATWNAGQYPPVFGDAELVKMATSVPAELARLDDKIGSIKTGLYADLLLVKQSDANPYKTLLHANPAEIRLVMINGTPVYGDADLMSALRPSQQLQPVNICGSAKSLFIEPVPGVPTLWSQVTEMLSAELNRWGTSLSVLTQCEGTNLH